MRVTAWKNSKHSSPNVMYGLAIPRGARDRFFDRQWRQVVLILPDGEQMIATLREAAG